MPHGDEAWHVQHHPDADLVSPFAPGTHTVDLHPARTSKHAVSQTFNSWNCYAVPVDYDQLLVGWEQIEADGTPCMVASLQVAVQFDTALLDRIPEKVITKAVLTYDETQATGCSQGFPGGGPCWTSGSRQPEDKPDGCVVVRVPSTNWTNEEPRYEVPYITDPRGPAITRLSVRGWDVTEPFRWQTELGAMPLQPPNSPALTSGFGFLLSGGLTIDQLQAEDNTNCVSEISNINLRTTYTIFEGQFNPPG